VELARAGTGAVAFADHDRYEFGNSVRHVLPIDALGLGKAEACAIAARRANPFCRATAHPLLLGATRFDVPPLDELRRLVAHADIVVEATGSQQLATLVCRIAREEGVPTIVCGMTNGYWGGEVSRIVPGETCCYVCFAHDQRAGVWAAPDEGPEPLVAAQGCSHPAVVGAGFDALEIAAVATRLTVQTLLRGDGYPDSGWDHAAISFRRDSADTERPRMVTERMPAKDRCSVCSGAVGFAA
jgi:molybdopterin/thiamine biosynthesis adenylyltransferase